MPKYRGLIAQPAVEYLQGEIEAESPEEAMRILQTANIPLKQVGLDSGVVCYGTTWTLKDANGKTLCELEEGEEFADYEDEDEDEGDDD